MQQMQPFPIPYYQYQIKPQQLVLKVLLSKSAQFCCFGILLFWMTPKKIVQFFNFTGFTCIESTGIRSTYMHVLLLDREC
jgi:hypothetical protein